MAVECSLLVFGSQEGVRRERLMQVCPGQQGQADHATDGGLVHPPATCSTHQYPRL